ncbi:Tim44/TimA family putative adaptor protein [Hyphomonas johnsonii]|jgi:predicted lipid-binding transport protein (Tim44 family)|uniref:Tim44 domain-containing protein n=1 Tax=Hyphomonas johnsonii MHS-2 TaxID=1280950 RepID=A0A059FMD9_9PROT|nr:Tim44/TimA family putative adaptor protein [Hyphomonas johnsonii]KCZ91777.1 Tim44 domain-containing protein [Hyphomonas johnsonii MHS-2]
MFDPVIEVLVLAAIALFVLSRLYMALGRGGNDRPVQRPASPAPGADAPSVDTLDRRDRREPADHPIFTGPAAGGLEDIYNADNSFSLSAFMQGAKSAYQMIVAAYARGDRDKLRPLLDDDVYEAWDAAITARETSGEKVFELLRIKRAEIESAELDGRTARIMIRYEAELGDGEVTRTAKEVWTYMRDVKASDPNWILDDVEIAS